MADVLDPSWRLGLLQPSDQARPDLPERANAGALVLGPNSQAGKESESGANTVQSGSKRHDGPLSSSQRHTRHPAGSEYVSVGSSVANAFDLSPFAEPFGLSQAFNSDLVKSAGTLEGGFLATQRERAQGLDLDRPAGNTGLPMSNRASAVTDLFGTTPEIDRASEAEEAPEKSGNADGVGDLVNSILGDMNRSLSFGQADEGAGGFVVRFLDPMQRLGLFRPSDEGAHTLPAPANTETLVFDERVGAFIDPDEVLLLDAISEIDPAETSSGNKSRGRSIQWAAE
jgi:hypothetical protein